jgi:hypothetical protein
MKKSIKARNQSSYLSMCGQNRLPLTGRHYISMNILKSQNYHICFGLISEPLKVSQNTIPSNCDVIYILDGAAHD